jgi:hypothetical protein
MRLRTFGSPCVPRAETAQSPTHSGRAACYVAIRRSGGVAEPKPTYQAESQLRFSSLPKGIVSNVLYLWTSSSLLAKSKDHARGDAGVR